LERDNVRTKGKLVFAGDEEKAGVEPAAALQQQQQDWNVAELLSR
jgi:hypothetical protein